MFCAIDTWLRRGDHGSIPVPAPEAAQYGAAVVAAGVEARGDTSYQASVYGWSTGVYLCSSNSFIIHEMYPPSSETDHCNSSISTILTYPYYYFCS